MSTGLGRGPRSDSLGVTDDRPQTSSSSTSPSCEECGYDLRASEPGRPCPECGRVPDSRATLVPAGAVWTVAVTAGLALLLLITLYGVTSVLVQRSDSAIGGMLPVLNLPGPKLWAMPLLQRPIGNAPNCQACSAPARRS